MKTHIFFLAFLMVAITVKGQDLPLKTQQLKDSYQKSVERAIAPLTKTYIAELTRQKIESTKAGSLKEALAIDAELNRIQSPEQNSNGTITEEQLINGTAIYEIISKSYRSALKFNKDGTMDSEYLTSWKLAGNTLRCQGPKNWNEFDASPKRVGEKLVLLETDSSAGKQEGARITLR